MDFLKRKLAPITESAWREIDEEAQRVLTTHLTARRVVDVADPKGFGFASVSLGRLHKPIQEKDSDLAYGVYQVKPLVEARIPFELTIWELDNVERGAKDVNLDALTTACKQIAEFEERAIYFGLESAQIVGILNGGAKPIKAKREPTAFLKGLAEASRTILANGISGPYALALSPGLWSKLVAASPSYPLKKIVLEIVDRVVQVPLLEDALVVSLRGGDLELVLGQDFSVGYLSHDAKAVKLYLTESFTFMTHEPASVQKLVCA